MFVTIGYYVCFQGDAGSMTEELMWNGLYKGHAYSVTGLLEVWCVYILHMVIQEGWGGGNYCTFSTCTQWYTRYLYTCTQWYTRYLYTCTQWYTRYLYTCTQWYTHYLYKNHLKFSSSTMEWRLISSHY